MIPKIADDLRQDFKILEQPTRTYRFNIQSQTIAGFTDGLEAMKQAIYKILNTERYEYLIYSWRYGIEITDLFGEAPAYIYPELKRRISEALTQDDRIQSVDAFSFAVDRGTVRVTFTVHTLFGDVEAEKVVRM